MEAHEYPKAMGGCVDRLYTLRAERLQLQHEVDEMKSDEKDLETHILNTFTKEELRGAKGDVATAAIKRTTSVVLNDWDAFVKYVVETESWDLLRKQPASNAVKARWDDKVEVPGTEPFVSIGLSLTKTGD